MPLIHDHLRPTVVLFLGLVLLGSVRVQGHPNHKLDLFYDHPGKANDPGDTLLIGNGALGAMISGGIARDTLHLNAKHLWTEEGYLPLGDLIIETGHQAEAVTSYLRRLDLQTALTEISYRHDRIRFQREYFASYPDNLLAARYEARRKGAINLVLGWKSPFPTALTFDESTGKLLVTTTFPGDRIVRTHLLCQPTGGTVTFADDRLTIDQADALTLFLAPAQTLGDRSIDPVGDLGDRTYTDVLRHHITDYQRLFHGYSLTLEGGAKTFVPTDKRLMAYRENPGHDPGFEELFFQYARYLLIASSRRGSLPAHNRGVWSLPGQAKPGYDPELALPLAYSLAEPTHLMACHQSLLGQSQLPGPAMTGNRAAWDHFDFGRKTPKPEGEAPGDFFAEPAAQDRLNTMQGDAWKTNALTRSGKGDEAHAILSRILQKQLHKNLSIMGKPWDFPATLGFATSMTGMLAQTRDGALHFLPALPKAWPDGNVQGFRMRGGYTVDFSWLESDFLEGYITAVRAGDCRVKLPGSLLVERADQSKFTPEKKADGAFVIPLSEGESVYLRRPD
ncbi:MAG: glycoside hydrolase N-terminal domain-containing protein [Verrucomicrobiota bacterium]